MSTFQLSPQVDANKVFLIRRGQLEGRIDPHQYHHERLAAIAALRKANAVLPLFQVVKSAKQITSEINPSDIYVGLENIVSDTGEYVATSEKQSISSAGVFKRGQILFPKLRPYLNKVYLAEFDGLCSTEFHIFETDKMSAEFLAIYLRSSLVVNQTRHLMTGNTLPRLQTEDINRLPVPLLSNDVQRKVVEHYQKANLLKQQKEEQAVALLASIDEYLLGELGISLPEQDNRLEKRIFRVRAREVSGGRLDPDYSKIGYKSLQQAIQKSKYQPVFLKDISDKVHAGKTPASTEYSEEPTQYPILKVGSYTRDFVNLDKVDFAYSVQPHTVKKGDIFVLSAAHQSEYVGRHIKYLQNEPEVKTSFVGELICIRVNERFNSMFLFSLLSMDLFKTLINREKTGQTSHVYGKDLKWLSIPSPSIEKQNEIAQHIQSIRAKAAQRQAEAAQILFDAKAQVERMILGEVDVR